jgi:hypothetical protein
MPVPSSCFRDPADEVDQIFELVPQADPVFGAVLGLDWIQIGKSPIMSLRLYSMSMPVRDIFSAMEQF